MRGVNKVIIVGTLGNDPELKYTAGGTAIATFSLATNESWTDKQTGEKQERTEWHRITAFGRLAEICGEYLKKGKQAYIEGSLRTEKWTDKEGIERWTTKIMAQELQMLGGPRDGPRDDAPSEGQASRQQARAAAKSAPAKTGPAAAPDLEDDDIPF